jgi:hypothetical protein
MIRGAGHREQQVRQPIHVSDQHAVDRRPEGDDSPLDATADRSGDMQRGAGGRAT